MASLFVLFSTCAVLCLQQTAAQSKRYQFGLNTCPRSRSVNSESDGTAYMTLYWDTVMYRCTFKPSSNDAYFGCDSSLSSTSRCDGTSYPYAYDFGDHFIQISRVGTDDVCIRELTVVISDTETNDDKTIKIVVNDEWLGNDQAAVGYRAVYANISATEAVQSISGTYVTSATGCDSLPPTASPTLRPTGNPTTSEPTASTLDPTLNPTKSPTTFPTSSPTEEPTESPSFSPTETTSNPTVSPTLRPTTFPTVSPTKYPTKSPSVSPTETTLSPTANPTEAPTEISLGDMGFEFGFRTCDDSDDEHVITLYWGFGMYQCSVTPSQDNTKYICDVDGDKDNVYRRCHHTNPDGSDVAREFKMQITSLGYRYSAACIDYVYVKAFDADNINDVVVDLTLDPYYTDREISPYQSRVYYFDPDTTQSGDYVDGTGTSYTPDCNPLVTVTVTACDNFDYGSTSNSLQIQLKGTLGASPWFFVNKLSPLPTKGESTDFEVYDVIPEDVGELYSVLISIDDSYGYCMANTTISIAGTEYVFSSEDYFGHGIVLGSSCDYTFKFVSYDFPLLSCIDNYLELNTYSTRGIYEVDIHTCIGDESGIAAPNMVDSVYMSIMGKKSGSAEWISSEPILLDHFVPGQVDLSSLGHLIASNAIIETNRTETKAIYPVGLDALLVGIKIESVNYEDNIISASSYVNVLVKQDENDGSGADETLDVFQHSVFEDGRYLIAFFKADSRLNISSVSQVYVYGYGGNHAVNIYLILDGYNDLYKLPFHIEYRGSRSNGLNWFDANDECIATYGTLLTSVHSADEQLLLQGFLADTSFNYAWLGLFDFTVDVTGDSNEWRWIDGSEFDFSNWDTEEDSDSSLFTEDGFDCTEFWDDMKWHPWDCDYHDDAFICSSPYFHKDTNRKFEVNIAQNIDEVIVVSVGNTNAEDNMCIDAISVNGESSRHIGTNWIGGDSGAPSLHAIFKYPVCSTEVIGLTIDFDSSTSNLINGDATITGLECTNNNRLISTTCSITQTYEMSKTTSFSISDETSIGSEYSWGTSQSHEASVEFSVEASYGVEVGQEPFKSTTEVTVGGSAGYTFTHESSQESTQSTENTHGKEATWETSETTAIECSAEAEVPPSHSLKYALIFNAFNTTINTYTDLKLTLCSAFTEADVDEDDSQHYIFIDNIPGIIAHKEVTACEVQFSAAEYLRNDITCEEEQQLAISLLSDYFPRCRDDGTYDGCQCDKDHSVCWCVDEAGNVVDGKSLETVDNLLWQDACVNKLECANTDINNDNLLAAMEDRMDCATAQKFAIYNADDYYPRCREHNSTLYDGCQCDLGDTLKVPGCWCVTPDGDNINGKAMQVLDGMSYQQVCVEGLQCDDSDVVYTCTEAQAAAITNGKDYLPRCRDDGTYDGCQCKTSDLGKQQRCWCVTADGSHVDGKAMQLVSTMTYQEACVQVLQCQDSDVEHAATTTTPTVSPFILNTLIGIVLVSFVVVLCVLYKRYGGSNMLVKYQTISQDSEFDSEAPLKISN